MDKQILGQLYRTTLASLSIACCIHLGWTNIACAVQTGGPSMHPTMPVSYSHAVVNMAKRHGRGIQVGDIVIATHPWFPSQGIGKRILGMPGDYVVLDPPSAADANVSGRGLSPNGLLEQKQETEGMMTQVPEGHCWLAGDNLPWSRDSRHFGPVPLGLISGKVVGMYRWSWWPFSWKWSWTWAENTLLPVIPEATGREATVYGLKGMAQKIVEEGSAQNKKG